jgi:hypothetical protein
MEKKNSPCDTLVLTLQMIYKHIGTIVFGHVLAYLPETVNTLMGRCERKYDCCYHTFCIFHKLTFRHLSKYCYFETILQSLPFCSANEEMFGLRERTKASYPAVYMMGNFYITLAKIFCVMCGLVICYFLIANSQVVKLFAQPSNILGPMIVVFFASLEISNHFINSTGLLGDTVVFAYSTDMEIQEKYKEIEPFSCPDAVRDVMNEVKGDISYIFDQ